MFAKVENGVTKSCQIFSPEKQEKRNFALKFSTFLAGLLVVRKHRHRRDQISDKNSRKKMGV